MIIVRVELHSARDGSITELARMGIDRIGQNASGELRDYRVRSWRGRSAGALSRSMRLGEVTRESKVLQHPSERLHIWHLVGKALAAMGYGLDG